MALSFARTKHSDKDIVKKATTQTTRTSIKGGGNNIATRIQSIVSLANQKLANHYNDYILIQDVRELREYINDARANGELAFDTETTGLNTLKDKIVGACLYTPGRKAAYVPINHRSYITGERLQGQLTEEQLKSELELFDGKWIFHNAKFDIRVMRHSCGMYIEPYWDTQLASKCINEKGSHALKDLHLQFCNSKDTESLKFDTLFSGVSFDLIPIKTGYLYAAGDAIKTYELYQYQKQLFESGDYEGPYNVFTHLEMPLITTVADMEDRGVSLDYEICDYLHNKYHKLREEAQERADKVLAMYKNEIDNYNMLCSHMWVDDIQGGPAFVGPTGKKVHPKKLDYPIKLSSPTQLAILFYDILKLESPDKKSPRGTSEDILREFAKGKHKDICEAILEIRSLDKLIGTYIDKMPQIVHDDGLIHCSYNQYGADTGRFSSSDPNMQNIPSHNKEIRKMFRAKPGYVLIGADYSQQEPMVTSFLSNDMMMQDAFKSGKDIYATIAAISFDKSYEDCLEFRPDGTTNPDGKERRTQAKSIVLGILYGRSIPSIAEQLGCSVKKAQEVYDKVLDAFDGLANFIVESQSMARELGYVETAWGRRRHIPDMQLPKYEFSYLSNRANFDPLAFDNSAVEVEPRLVEKYTKQLDKAKYAKERNDIIYNARQEGIKIKDNSFKISEAERQCVNSRVQGSAADMVKLAMRVINNDKEMQELDFHLIIQVHDEVIGECPKENAKKAADRLSYLMRTAPTELIDLPFKCDTEITENWYGESVEV